MAISDNEEKGFFHGFEACSDSSPMAKLLFPGLQNHCPFFGTHLFL